MTVRELSAMSSENIVATALGDDDEGDAYWDCVRELHDPGAAVRTLGTPSTETV